MRNDRIRDHADPRQAGNPPQEKDIEFLPCLAEGFATFCVYTVIHFCKLGGPFGPPLMFMLLVPLIGGISGGHINPAVTYLFKFIEKHHNQPKANTARIFSYMGSQVFGCLLSGTLVHFVRIDDQIVKVIPAPGVSLIDGCLYEFFGTLMLCIIVCHFAHPAMGRDALLNGFVLFFFFACTTISFGAKSGDFVNPAITMSTGILQLVFHGDMEQFRMAIMYTAFQFAGAPIAYLLYRNYMSVALYPEDSIVDTKTPGDLERPLITIEKNKEHQLQPMTFTHEEDREENLDYSRREENLDYGKRD